MDNVSLRHAPKNLQNETTVDCSEELLRGNSDSLSSVLFFFLIFFFSGATGGWTQDLVHVEHMLLHWTIPPPLISFLCTLCRRWFLQWRLYRRKRWSLILTFQWYFHSFTAHETNQNYLAQVIIGNLVALDFLLTGAITSNLCCIWIHTISQIEHSSGLKKLATWLSKAGLTTFWTYFLALSSVISARGFEALYKIQSLLFSSLCASAILNVAV